MNSKPDFDPDWPASSRDKFWPFRSIRQLMIIVAASGLLLAAVVTLGRQPLSSMIRRGLGLPRASTVPQRLAMVQGRGRAAQPGVFRPQPRDPLVIIAPEAIDPGMVVRTPAWIDPKMVFTPRGSDWQPEQRGLPAPRVQGIARQNEPQYKVVPIPDGSLPCATKPRRSLDPTHRR